MEELRKLLTLQELDQQLDSLNAKSKELEIMETIDKLKMQLNGTDQESRESKQQLQSLRSELLKSQREAERIEFNIKKEKDVLYGGEVTNVKELTFVQQQITAEENRLELQEGNMIEIMEEIEVLTERCAKLEETNKTYSDQLSTLATEATQLIEKIEQERKLMVRERKKLVANIGQKLLKEYEKKKDKMKGALVSTINEDRICQGCHVRIAYHDWQLAKEGNRIRCEGCGRYLVVLM